MRFKNCTLGYVKKLYLQKVRAIEEKDPVKIDYLQLNYPELFNPHFLLDLLRNEFERDKKGLDDNIILQNYLFQYH